MTLSSLWAMGQVHQDVLYLKNGGVLRGVVLEDDDSTTVKIEILGGNVFVVETSEIDKRTIEPAPKLKSKGIITTQPNGLYHEFDMGFPMGFNDNDMFTTGITLDYILGYQYKPKLKFGIGTGINNYIYGTTLVPVFARVTGDLMKTAITPFYITDLGFASNISTSFGNEEHRGGLMLFVGTGFKFNTRSSVNYNISTGYKTQFASTHRIQDWQSAPYSEYRQFNRIELKIGIGF